MAALPLAGHTICNSASAPMLVEALLQPTMPAPALWSAWK
jgi:hypothetical protein